MRLDDALERATDLLSRLSPCIDQDHLMITRAELREHGWLFFDGARGLEDPRVQISYAYDDAVLSAFAHNAG